MIAIVTNIDNDHLGTHGGDFEQAAPELRRVPAQPAVLRPRGAVRRRCRSRASLMPQVGRPIVTYGLGDGRRRARDGRACARARAPRFDVLRPAPAKRAARSRVNLPGAAQRAECSARPSPWRTELGDRRRGHPARTRWVPGHRPAPAVRRRQCAAGDGHGPVDRRLSATTRPRSPRRLDALRQAYARPPRRAGLPAASLHAHRATCSTTSRRCSSGADALLVTEVYAAGEAPIDGADGRAICRAIRTRGKVEPVFVGAAEFIAASLAIVIRDGDVVVTMGAGRIGALAHDIRACCPWPWRREEIDHDPAHPVADPARFGRVAVLLGGTSSEREVSLNSAQRPGGAAAARRRRTARRRRSRTGARADRPRRGFDRMFNILHGSRGGGEDGVLGMLDALGVPYTGSGVLGIALSMDKIRTKQVWQAIGLPTPAFVSLERGEDVVMAAHRDRLAGDRETRLRRLERRREPLLQGRRPGRHRGTGRALRRAVAR
jgi:hypothetical protein